jgi:ABC-2 type transport system permease protein
MSRPLFRADIRAHRTVWVAMLLVFWMYFAIMVSMYDPEGAQAMENMLKMLPEAMVRALGFDQLGTTLYSLLANSMYGFLLFGFPMVVSITVNHGVIASHVDRGSMVYLLSTPNSRGRIAATQAAFSLASITTYFAMVTAFGLAVTNAMFPGAMPAGRFILLNLYALATYLAIGGIGFFASCIANEARTSLSLGIGIPLGSLVLRLLSRTSDRLTWLDNLSVLGLFEPMRVHDGSSFVYGAMLAYVALALGLYAAGIGLFRRRDLHI